MTLRDRQRSRWLHRNWPRAAVKVPLVWLGLPPTSDLECLHAIYLLQPTAPSRAFVALLELVDRVRALPLVPL